MKKSLEKFFIALLFSASVSAMQQQPQTGAELEAGIERLEDRLLQETIRNRRLQKTRKKLKLQEEQINKICPCLNSCVLW
jgi:hypothetical protein